LKTDNILAVLHFQSDIILFAELTSDRQKLSRPIPFLQWSRYPQSPRPHHSQSSASARVVHQGSQGIFNHKMYFLIDALGTDSARWQNSLHTISRSLYYHNGYQRWLYTCDWCEHRKTSPPATKHRCL